MDEVDCLNHEQFFVFMVFILIFIHSLCYVNILIAFYYIYQSCTHTQVPKEKLISTVKYRTLHFISGVNVSF